MRRFGSGISEHPLPTHAIGEVIGHVGEAVGPRPDLAVLFVHHSLAGVLHDFVATIQAALAPLVLIGTTTGSVIGGRRQSGGSPAVGLWAVSELETRPIRIDVQPTANGIGFGGFDPDALVNDGVLVLMSDPFSFPIDGFLRGAAERYPELEIVGGAAWGAPGPGSSRLVFGSSLFSDGAVGFWCDRKSGISARVAQGTRPIGSPLTVTASSGSRILELAGRPAGRYVADLIDSVGQAEQNDLIDELQIGLLVDQHGDELGAGDFVMRPVVSWDGGGEVTVGDSIAIGSVVQFQVRDRHNARDELARSLRGADAGGGLLFAGYERDRGMFDDVGNDAKIVADILDDPAIAGMTCAGEMGPVRGRNYLHNTAIASVLFSA